MRKYIAQFYLSLIFVSTSANAGWFDTQDVGFKAPSVDGTSHVISPELGAIILNTTDSKFYGNTSSNPSSPSWTAFSGSGSVLSVGLSAPAEFSVSGSPVTTSGTLTFTKANQNANIVFAGPVSGAASAPTFRTLVTPDMPLAITTKTANYTATTADDVILCNTNAFTVTLPAASNAGKVIQIKKIGSDANAITIARAGSDTIQGDTSFILNSQYESVKLVADGGTTWYVSARDYSVPLSVQAYTAAGTGFFRRTNTSYGSMTVNGTFGAVTVVNSFGLGAASVSTSAPTATSWFQANNIPPGLYEVEISGVFTNTSSSSDAYVQLTDGTTHTGEAWVIPATNQGTHPFRVFGYYQYNSVSSPAFYLRAKSTNADSTDVYANANSRSIYFSLKRIK